MRRDGALGVVRSYPLPFAAGIGLAVGGLAVLLHHPDLARWIWLATLIGGGAPLLYRTGRRLLRGELSADVVAMLAIGGAIALDQAFAGVIIVVMQSGGEALEGYAFRRASSSLEGLLARAPRRTHRRRDGSIEEIAVEAVVVGDALVVRTGDFVPVDGTVQSPEALLDESAVTGEPLPKRRRHGEGILSGSVNAGPPFDMRADRVSAESQYARIVGLVEEARTEKPSIERLADRYATWFTPATVAFAVAGWLWTGSAVTALAVLVVATPCPLIIAVPVAVVGAVDRASEHGLIIKSGTAVEEVGRARAVLFDKTGTITSGRPEIERIVPLLEGWDEERILRFAGALEQLSSHPIGSAIAKRAREKLPRLPDALGAEEVAGAGLFGKVEGREVVIGSVALCERRLGRPLDGEPPKVGRSGPLTGRMICYLAVDGAAVGAIVFSDPVRSGVAPLVERLGALGVGYVGILTGDSPENAAEVARAAGILHFEAELLPEEKVERVRGARARLGSTIMVGDGINDAAALAAASVGIAMGARGAAVAAEAADIVILVDDVGRVGDVVALGQRMVRIARQGIFFGLGASVVLMVIAAGGFIVPALGAGLQELLDIIVIGNALRVR